MENRREEFLKTVCQIYMAAVLVVLPLYYIPGNGYYKLGDSKYYLYRNISLICMGICLAVQIIAVVRSCRMENSSSSGIRCHQKSAYHQADGDSAHVPFPFSDPGGPSVRTTDGRQ